MSFELHDIAPPESEVDALPEFTYSPFWVSWQGTDQPEPDGAGIAYYEVQYLDSEIGIWTDWLPQVIANGEIFDLGEPGHTYYFRCCACDNNGNMEDYHVYADAWTTVVEPEPPWKVDLSIDCDNNGEIDEYDDEIEEAPPGKIIVLNDDRDNGLPGQPFVCVLGCQTGALRSPKGKVFGGPLPLGFGIPEVEDLGCGQAFVGMKTYTWSSPQWQTFNRVFWDRMNRGKTVYEAAHDAWSASGVGQWQIVITGDRNMKLRP